MLLLQFVKRDRDLGASLFISVMTLVIKQIESASSCPHYNIIVLRKAELYRLSPRGILINIFELSETFFKRSNTVLKLQE